jgi:quinol monooxygenase YgiN
MAVVESISYAHIERDKSYRGEFMAETIVLNVHIEAKEGRQEDLARELQALVAPTRLEIGCLTYELHRDPEDERKFMFYEQFEDQQALDAHLAAPYFKRFVDYREQDDPVLGQTVTRWNKLI